MPVMHFRCIWSASNTFKGYWSPDGVTWAAALGGTSHSHTMTPTHFILGVSAHAGESDEEQFGQYHYFRVYDSDLSA